MPLDSAWVLALVIVLALIAIGTGIAVFVVDSMARATYALAASFVTVGLLVLGLRLEYIGLVTVLMMMMEMAIMAVFMVMYMGMNPALMPMSMVHGKRAALAVSIAVFVVLAGGAVLVPWPVPSRAPAADPTRSLGEAIMGSHMLVMLGVSAVLFATIIAGTMLTLGRGRYDRYGADLRRRRPDDPLRGGVGR